MIIAETVFMRTRSIWYQRDPSKLVSTACHYNVQNAFQKSLHYCSSYTKATIGPRFENVIPSLGHQIVTSPGSPSPNFGNISSEVGQFHRFGFKFTSKIANMALTI